MLSDFKEIELQRNLTIILFIDSFLLQNMEDQEPIKTEKTEQPWKELGRIEHTPDSPKTQPDAFKEDKKQGKPKKTGKKDILTVKPIEGEIIEKNKG